MIDQRIFSQSKGKALLQLFDVLAPNPGQILLKNEYTVISAATECANFMNLSNAYGQFP
jgi:hypothetical protein